MPSRPFRRFALSALAAAMTALATASPTLAAPSACDHYAAPTGSDSAPGTAGAPLRTAQRLIDGLQAGETGCLRGGVYSDEVTGPYVARFGHGGADGAPLTLRSAPGERATLRGIVFVPEGSDHVTISGLDIDGRRVGDYAPSTGLRVNAADTVVEGNDITNRSTAICSVLGHPGWGTAVRTVVTGNTFHDCGDPGHGFFDHSLYLDLSVDARITDNLFLRSASYAVHLYPDARGALVANNVMVGNGAGVKFAGDADAASTDNLVERNVIAGSTRRTGIESWWGGRVGTGNVARFNCLANDRNFDSDKGWGFTATDNVDVATAGFADPAHGDYRLSASSPCLPVVGYDTVAKLHGEVSAVPAAAPLPAAARAPSAALPTASSVATKKSPRSRGGERSHKPVSRSESAMTKCVKAGVARVKRAKRRATKHHRTSQAGRAKGARRPATRHHRAERAARARSARAGCAKANRRATKHRRAGKADRARSAQVRRRARKHRQARLAKATASAAVTRPAHRP